jgi:hypothetical protein
VIVGIGTPAQLKFLARLREVIEHDLLEFSALADCSSWMIPNSLPFKGNGAGAFLVFTSLMVLITGG